jgi:hypothetical protein
VIKYLIMATIIFMTGCAAKTNTTDSVQTVSPQGEYSKVNTSNSDEANKLLLNGSKKEKQKTIKEIQEHPDQYAPPVFTLSLVSSSEKEKKMRLHFGSMLVNLEPDMMPIVVLTFRPAQQFRP